MTLDRLRPGDRVYLDTNLFIYTVERVEPFFRPTTHLLRLLYDAGAEIVTSEITVAECLIEPYRRRDTDRIDRYRQLFDAGDIELVPVGTALLLEAARIGGTNGLKLFDAIHLASAAAAGAMLVVTNDKRLRAEGSVEIAQLASLGLS